MNVLTPSERPNFDTQTLSIVVPVCNEQDVLPEFHRRVADVLARLGMRAEIVYVNDGSTDSTLSVMERLRSADPRVGIIDLSRNFGKEIALTAGLDHARGDAIVVIDADLQDPPELIPELVRGWRDGHDVVYAQRISREGESALKKSTAYLFYRLIHAVSRVNVPPNTGDFRLLSRRALDAVLQLREQHRFMKGLFAWVGYSQTAIPYHRDARTAGETKWNYLKLWEFALDGITSFTTVPLKVATYLGLVISLFAFVYGGWIIVKTVAFGDPVAGYPSLIVVVLFLGGVQLACLGIIGEYLARLSDESKGRPLYFLKGLALADFNVPPGLPGSPDHAEAGSQSTPAVSSEAHSGRPKPLAPRAPGPDPE